MYKLYPGGQAPSRLKSAESPTGGNCFLQFIPIHIKQHKCLYHEALSLPVPQYDDRDARKWLFRSVGLYFLEPLIDHDHSGRELHFVGMMRVCCANDMG